jgi:hypothetical protein
MRDRDLVDLSAAAAAWRRDGFVVLPGYLAGPELQAAQPPGYLLAERPDHRGTEITAPRSARYSAHVSYRHADNSWTSRYGWGDRSFHPDWRPFVEHATARQLLLFGFRPPGHPYWTGETITQLQVRYPNLDPRPWPPSPGAAP